MASMRKPPKRNRESVAQLLRSEGIAAFDAIASRYDDMFSGAANPPR